MARSLSSVINEPEHITPIGAALPPPRRRRAGLVFAGLLLAAAAAVSVVALLGRDRESTDDAQVDGHVINVAARVAGQVARVLVHDNQAINPGDLLVELDRGPLEAQALAARADVLAAKAGERAAQAQVALTRQSATANLRQARGGVVQAVGQLGSSSAGVDQARGEVSAARSRQSLARSELLRIRQLREQGVGTPAELDQKTAALEQAEAALEQAQARLAGARTAETGLRGSITTARGRLLLAKAGPAQIEVAEAAAAQAAARVEQASAVLRLAELNLSYATIKAPVRGVISRRTVEVGQSVAPDRPLLALVPLDDLWITANFKEDQIAAIRPGQAARVHIDALPDHDLPGRVDSIAGASGARFSLLPPENASGNFIKVVQRIPVLIRLDGAPQGGLLPGMSTAVTILTRTR